MARDLSLGYEALGHSSWLAVGEKRSEESNIFRIRHNQSGNWWSRCWWGLSDHLRPFVLKQVWGSLWVDRLARVLAAPGKLYGSYQGREDFYFPGTWDLPRLTPQKPDLIHCHNLHGGYFDLRALSWLSGQIPVVLTMHDAWLLSGHCAHSLACKRWETGCGLCPDLTIPPAIRRDATAFNWQRKREIYAKSRLYVATPSHWLMQKVEQSILAPSLMQAKVIPYGINLDFFKPTSRQHVRTKLDIPSETAVLLFAASGIQQSVWKDYQTLRTSIMLIGEQVRAPVLFIALGEEGQVEQIGSVKIKFIPYQNNPETVASYYQAADVYLHAARADTFPNTVLEALACGTPVVATAVGGIPEQVKGLRFEAGSQEHSLFPPEKATGILVSPGDAIGMAKAVRSLLEQEGLRHQLGENAAVDARQRFDLNRQIEDYLAWYQEIINRWHIDNNSAP